MKNHILCFGIVASMIVAAYGISHFTSSQLSLAMQKAFNEMGETANSLFCRDY